MSTLIVSSDLPANKNFRQSVILDIFAKIGEQTTYGFFLIPFNRLSDKFQIPFLKQNRFKLTGVANEQAYRFRGVPFKLRFLTTLPREVYRKYWEVPKYSREILSFVKSNNIERIFVLLDGQTSVWVTEYLCKANIVISIYPLGTPDWWAHRANLDRFSSFILMKSFDRCLMHATNVYTYSGVLSKLYSERYNREVHFYRGSSQTCYLNQAKDNTGIFSIGIVGDIFPKDVFLSFINALDSVFWELDGKKVEIHYFGDGEIPHKCTRIIRHELVEYSKIDREFKKIDLMYFPYWFGNTFEMTPDIQCWIILEKYLKFGAPIFYHGSENSEIANQLQQYEAAVICGSSDIEVIKMNLRKVLYAICQEKMNENAIKMDMSIQESIGRRLESIS